MIHLPRRSTMLYRPNLAALDSGDLPRVKAELDRCVLALQGVEDGLWVNARSLAPITKRLCEDGLEAVRAEMDPDDYDTIVQRLAAVVHCLGEISKIRETRDMAAAMLDDE